MRIVRGYRHLQNLAASIVTVGNFDGVHRGHRSIIETVVRQGQRYGLVPTVVTFEPLPEEYFAHIRQLSPMARLTTMRIKAQRLAQLGVQQLVILPFTTRLAMMEAERFLEAILIKGLNARSLVIGDDFRFGHRRRGDFALLQAMQKQYGYTLEASSSILHDGVRVSSSQIRQWLADGEMARANQALGWEWYFESRVVQGDRLGRTIGFPTANLRLGKIRPPLSGVYAVVGGRPGRSEVWQGVANVGIRPTVSGRVWRFEVHWFDVDDNLYGQRLWVRPIARVRPESKFASLAALQRQIEADCRAARAILSEQNQMESRVTE